jgi:type 1 glutamine amidotransferase
MLLRSFLPRLLAAALFTACLHHPAMAAADAPKKVLFFSKSSNFEHSVIKRFNGQPSWVENVLSEQGPRRGIDFVFSKDGSLFTAEYLAQFDGFMFYTSGELTAVGRDGNPPMTPAGKAAFLDAIYKGKGFVGVHSAGDTFHTGETAATVTSQARTWRYKHHGDQADPYIRMLGGELIVHGTQQIAKSRVVDPGFPGFAYLGATFPMMEEWYSMTDFSPDMHVILVLETASMRDPNAGPNWPPPGGYIPYQRPDYPTTWARMHGEGRVFYTAIGHREDTWTNPIFHDMLFGGLAWSVRKAEAAVTPNLKQVAPGAYELPPVSAPVGGLPPVKK